MHESAPPAHAAQAVASPTPTPHTASDPGATPKNTNRNKGLAGALQRGDFTRAVTIIAGQPDPLRQRNRAAMRDAAETLIHEGSPEAAITLLTPYLAQWPDDADATLLLARARLENGAIPNAIALLQSLRRKTADQALLHDGEILLNDAIARYDHGLMQQNRWGELLDFYRRLSTEDGGNSRYQLRQAELLTGMGQADEALALLEPLRFNRPEIATAAQRLRRQIEARRRATTHDAIKLTRLQNHFLVPLRFGGQHLELLLDTGASLTMLARRALPDGLVARPAKAVTIATADGQTTLPTVVLPELTIGAQRLRDVRIALNDKMAIPGADGLLGMDILKRFDFIIDQSAAILRLTPRGSTP